MAKNYNRKFLNTFFAERKQVGAVAPSSKFLVNAMCNKIDFKEAKCIIELGPGTGVFTSELFKRSSPDCTLILIELNRSFFELLKEKFRDNRIIILNRSADEIQEILQEHNFDKVDAVLSSLPLTVIPTIVKKRIVISSHEVLKEGGVFVQYQYSLNAKKMLELKFGKMRIGFVPINVPPAFIYTGTKVLVGE
jgi:phospholipid N-methyltransferase